MDHAEVLTRLADAAATPRGLDRIDADRSADGVALHQHLQSCADCRAELVAWQRTSAALLDAAPDTLRAPAAARDRILSAVVREGTPRGAVAALAAPAAASGAAGSGDAARAAISGLPSVPMHLHPDDTAPVLAVVGSASSASPARLRSPLRFRQLALAAAAVLVIFVAGAVLGTPLGLTPKDKGVAALVAAVQASDQILQVPGHREAVLWSKDGNRVGSVLVNPTTGDIVVLSSELDASATDYHCNLVRDAGPAMWIGPMLTQSGTSYWAGRVTSVADLGKPGDVIQVVDGGTAPELTATF